MFSPLRDPIISLLSPRECSVCGLHVERLDLGAACLTCWAQTRFFTPETKLCSKCGAFFPERSAPKSLRCGKCEGHSYDRAAAIGIYEKALAATVIQLKTSPSIPKKLVPPLKAVIENAGFSDAEIIVPTPLSRRRLLERGFNQAETIGIELGKVMGIPVDALSLERKLHTPIHRVAMDMKAREMTVKNAFSVKRPKFIAGRSVLLVDDVLTSGSTASYCASVLKKSGAAEVNVFTLARAISD